MKFKNHYNHVAGLGMPRRGEHQTIEDQSLTVAQHLQRIQGGIPYSPAGLQYPDNEEDMSFRIQDLTDIDEMFNILDKGLKKVKEANERAEKAKNEQKGEPKEQTQLFDDLSDAGAPK